MQMRRARSSRTRRRRLVLLVGLPPLQLDALRPSLEEVADVCSVPFPGAAFDRAAEEAEYGLVVVDVTYLDERRVRPLINRRFAHSNPPVVYLSTGGGARLHDLATAQSWPLPEPSLPELVALASGSPLTLVADR